MASSEVSADLGRRFSGLERLYGVDAARAIRSAHVVVVGIGGVGSWVAEALARSGVGHLTLIDLDHVAESNINRQVHALSTSIGMAEVLAMQERIALINPSCIVNCIEAFVEPDNWHDLLPSDADATVDACDQIKAKTAMADWARRSKALFIPWWWVRRVANAMRTRSMWQTSAKPPTTPCWHSYATACARPTVHRVMASAWESLVCSVVRR